MLQHLNFPPPSPQNRPQSRPYRLRNNINTLSVWRKGDENSAKLAGGTKLSANDDKSFTLDTFVCCWWWWWQRHRRCRGQYHPTLLRGSDGGDCHGVKNFSDADLGFFGVGKTHAQSTGKCSNFVLNSLYCKAQL